MLSKWRHFTPGNLVYFFVPFSDFKNNISDPIIIVSAVIWSVIIEVYKLELPFGTEENNLVISILSGALGFLLSLNLTHYLEQNKQGMEYYETFIDNTYAIAWMVCALEDPDEKRINVNDDIDKQDLISSEDDYYIRLKYKTFGILKILPAVLKHVFRGDYNLDNLERTDKDPFVRDVIQELRKMEENDSVTNPVDNLMFLLMLKLKHLKGDITVIHSKWDSLYSHYSAISALVSYGTPIIFSYVLVTALGFYTLLLPLGYSGYSSYNVGITFVIMYFFIGLNSAGKFVRNPFIHLPDGVTIFPTSTNLQKNARITIDNIEKHGERDGTKIDKLSFVAKDSRFNNIKFRYMSKLNY